MREEKLLALEKVIVPPRRINGETTDFSTQINIDILIRAHHFAPRKKVRLIWHLDLQTFMVFYRRGWVLASHNARLGWQPIAFVRWGYRCFCRLLWASALCGTITHSDMESCIRHGSWDYWTTWSIGETLNRRSKVLSKVTFGLDLKWIDHSKFLVQ